MSFETARTVTPSSFSQEFQFTRRPAVQYPTKAKQAVNISDDTLKKFATRKSEPLNIRNFSYRSNGLFGSEQLIGTRLNASA
ncbi:hypothetical protein [Pelagicoccus albus]|uniref:Uncharacterized protein n=1 Tax=Pelagicoccus albus TaxID=415222 RepID=A0A7X1BAJ2_9BACT|nr:hypothetical protein [Pelagicoccus albus]MBC2607380.1 hypothetical protein [Pelagicoccus albus]